MDRLCDSQVLCVLQMNVQRISNINKFQDIIAYISSMTVKPDALIFTETWITQGTEGLYQIPGYDALHCCRETQSAGIAFFFKKDLKCEMIDQSNDEVSFMHVAVYRTTEPGKKLLITAVYMPDSRNFQTLNTRLNGLLSNDSTNHLLMGDFNINILSNSAMTNTYLDTVDSLGYRIRNTFPTRPSSGSLIDHVITNFENSICITIANDLSDHNGTIVLFDGFLGDRPTNGYMTIHRSKTDFEGVSSDMSSVDLNGLDVEPAFSCFHSRLTESIAKNTSEIFLKVNKNNPFASAWVNEAQTSKKEKRWCNQQRSE